MTGLTVVPVRTRQELRAFIGLPFRLYRQDPYWVAPLRRQQRRQLDRDHNPFFRDAEAAYFLVRRDGRTVGRISAQVDHRYNRFHSQPGTPDTTGFFGFFECEQDPAAAAALFDAAEAWLAQHGSTQLLGPASFTFVDEAGLLVDGYDAPPAILMAYNPPYYQRLLEGAGFMPTQDLYAWRLDATTQPPPDVVAAARSAEAHYRFRPTDPRHVLVCPITSPVWSVLFPTIGALVTDTGGILSHPAIIAREHRVPAVVATGNATGVLRDDQVVTVDGTSGQVEVIR